MKIFLSALENAQTSGKNGYSVAKYLVEHNIEMLYNLMSFFTLKGN